MIKSGFRLKFMMVPNVHREVCLQKRLPGSGERLLLAYLRKCYGNKVKCHPGRKWLVQHLGLKSEKSSTKCYALKRAQQQLIDAELICFIGKSVKGTTIVSLEPYFELCAKIQSELDKGKS